MNFLNKTVEKISHFDPEKKGLVVFDGTELLIDFEGKIYKLYKYNDVSGTLDRYSSPENDYFPLWTKKVSSTKNPSHIDKVNKVWWRYKPGLKLKGTIKDDTFYPNK